MAAKRLDAQNRPSFDLSVSVDRTSGRIDAVYIQLREGKAVDVREFAHGDAFANYDHAGHLLGIELLAPCKVNVLNKITREIPQRDTRKQARQFIRSGVPGGMLVGVS
ncbi:MAG: DUF2283 domain-containing protein [Planctomycetaceae bacterium]|nr:DUF2283 domain-containing protein [Planctomycetaceae bacterium]